MARTCSVDEHRDLYSRLVCGAEEAVEKNAAHVALCDALIKLGVPVHVEGTVEEEMYQYFKKWYQEEMDKGKKPLFDMALFKPFRFVTPSYEVANGVKLHGSGSDWKYVGLLGMWRENKWGFRFSLFRDVPYADGQVVRLWCEKEGDEEYRQVLSVKEIERDVPFFSKYTKIVKHGLPLEEIAGFFRENGSSDAVLKELVEFVGRERRYLPNGTTVDSYVDS